MSKSIASCVDEIIDGIENFYKNVDCILVSLENSDLNIEFASKSVGFLEGYYSPSKADLFVGGIKRGRLLKKPKGDFSGFKYFF